MNGLRNQFQDDVGRVRLAPAASGACQDGRRADKWAVSENPRRGPLLTRAAAAVGAAVAIVLVSILDRLAQIALKANFRHVRVLHRERFPRRGAALLVANHPSAWADAVVLLGAFERKLHFLVEGEQFHPWPRGALLRLFGALPVFARATGDPDAAAKNAATFRRCEELFDRGEVVAVFPEGVSETDRTLMPLRLGAARIAIAHVRRDEGRRPFAMIEVGLHYSDRVAFRSDVTVNVGEPLGAGDLLRADDAELAASRLTDCMAREIRALALGAIRPRQAAVLAALEPIAERVAWDLDVDDPSELLAASLDRLEQEDPETFEQVAARALVQARWRRALRIADRALAAPPRRRRGARRAAARVFTVLGALPAAAGAVIHAVPACLTNAATRRLAREPAQVAFVRIAAGAILFLAAYAGAAWLLLFAFCLGPEVTSGALGLAAVLGACALAYTPRARTWGDRLRLAWIALRHLDLVCRVRTEEEWLTRRVLALLEYGLEAPDVDPAHAPVLELGARPSALSR